ncbi:MAG: hydantoinase/oxoprolinase family protein [Acidimicrobiales bacterium]
MGVRLAADIGGTFTDVVLEIDGGEGGRSGGESRRGGDDGAPRQATTKVLTTPTAPADGVLDGVERVLADAGVDAADVDLVVHGTTLATNALIERRGAVTAMLTTEGFRDSVAMAHENRFEQYDLAMERPEPLVPRHLRLGVPERLAADGEVLLPLDVDAVRALLPTLDAARVTSVAVGFLHSYVDPSHERQVAEILAAERPELSVTLSSDVCPEIREYERLSTACANAYVQPLMAAYLTDLDQRLTKLGVTAPLLLMLSNGGLCTLDTAVRSPVGLIESGPAGGALLAARVAAEHGLDRPVAEGGGPLLSFDMGGTTAKLCLLDEGRPGTSREFEVARVYRFLKGSGLPLRMPVIDLVEIGAGGGSIASVDRMGRVAVGPGSAGSEPGPACYGRGGTLPTVTDADVVAGRINGEWFAGGRFGLDADRARDAVADGVAGPLGIEIDDAVIGVGEMVAEHMANAARVHAVERGRDLHGGAMVAFGGAAPIHACRLADRLGIDTVIVPPGAGVGSAIGFLRAPVSYELVRTCHQRLDRFDHDAVNRVVDELRTEARLVVEAAAGPVELVESLHASMRYRGQGHEIDVDLPLRPFGPGPDPGPGRCGVDELSSCFDRTYRSLYTRVIPGMVAEALTWRVRVSTVVAPPAPVADPDPFPAEVRRRHRVLDPEAGWVDAALVPRHDLTPGATVPGPALIVEDQTTTVVGPAFIATVDGRHHLVLRRRPGQEGEG